MSLTLAIVMLLVPAAALAALRAPTISGEAVVGGTLRASVEDGPPGLVYQWARLSSDNRAEEAARGPGRYTVTESDIGHELYVRAGDPATSEISDWSEGTRRVPSPRPAVERPRNISQPGVSDSSPRVGNTLTGSRGRWTGTEPVRYVEDWLRCRGDDCEAVGTGSSYVVRAEDAGFRLQFRVEGTNEAGSDTARSDRTRTVPTPAPAGTPPAPPAEAPTATPAPEATTDAATDVTATTATARGTVNPRGQAVSYRFEYGVTEAYGSTTPPTPVPAGSSPLAVQAALTGLAPGTAHHVRLVIDSARGIVTGADVAFTTLAGTAGGPAPPSAAGAPAPAIPPPVAAVTNFTARVDANVVRLAWAAATSGKAKARVTVVRRFGRKPTSPDDGTVVYRGRAQRTIDVPVARRRVWYAAFLADARATPTKPVYTSVRRFYPSLLTPYEDATVGRSVRFAWRRVKGAAYYNVQIWDGRVRRRLVVRWPTTRMLRLRLRPGSYRWYVYPGYGPLREARYGALHGQGAFKVR